MRQTERMVAVLGLAVGLACGRPEILATGPRIGVSRQQIPFRHCADPGRGGEPQLVGIRNSGDGVLATPDVSVRYVEQAGSWLRAELAADGDGYALQLQVIDPGGEPLPAGSYHATVVLDSPGAENSPVALAVSNDAVQKAIQPPASPYEITAAIGRNGWSRPLRLEEALGCDLVEPTLTVFYSGAGSWLQFGAPTLFSTGAQSWWEAELLPRTVGLPAGEYDAVVTASSAGAAPVDVPVHLTVQDWGLVPAPGTRYCQLPLQLADGRILCADPGQAFDVATGRWTEVPWSSLPSESPQRAAVLANGDVILFSSTCADESCTANVLHWEVFDSSPACDPCRVASGSVPGNLPETVVPLADGRVLLTPDLWAMGSTGETSVLDPARGTVVPAGKMRTPRQYATAVRLRDGRVLFAGGFDVAWAYQSSAELFDPTTRTWKRTGSMSSSRAYCGAALLSDGRVLAAGGYGITSTWIFELHASAEIYDPATGTWSPTGSMRTPRIDFGNFLTLPDGTVLVTGGMVTEDTLLAKSERFDPETGRWSPWASLPAASAYHRTFLVDGSWIVVVGVDSGAGWIRRLAYP